MTHVSPSKLLVHLAESSAKSRKLVGGKASNLAKLAGAGFPVPDTVVVTTLAYEIYAACCETDFCLPDGLTQQIVEAASRLILPEASTAFAVRSSAVAEDTLRASYAGIFASFLGASVAEIPCYVSKCWKSAESHAAIRYGQGLECGSCGTGMAVIIQPMISALVTGVAFTADPLTLDPSRMIVSVQDADQRKTQPGKNEVECFQIERDHAVSKKVALATRSTQLPAREVETLRSLLLAIETLFGHPVDVEWAWDGKEFWVLQARPITNPALGVCSHAIWSSMNLGEILPGIPTPSTWSVVSQRLEYAFRRLFAQFGYTWPESEMIVARIWGHGYMNVSRLSDFAWLLFGMPPDVATEALGGMHDAVVPAVSDLSPKDRLRQLVDWLRLTLIAYRTANKSSVLFETTVEWYEEKTRRLKEPVSGKELESLVTELQQRGNVFMYSYLVLILGAIGTYALLKRAVTNWASTGTGAIGELLTGLGEMPSADIARRLQGIAESVPNNPSARDWLSQEAWGDWRLELADTQLGRDLSAFLDIYGHRTASGSELEMANPRWSEDISSILQLLNGACTKPLSRSTSPLEVQQRRRKEMETTLTRSLPLHRRILTRLVISEAQRFTRLREKGKHHLLYLAALGRTVLQLIGQRLVESGTLEAVEDVFFLSLQEVLNGVVDREMGIGRVRERKAEVARFERLEPPPVFTGPIPHYPERGSESLISLKGIASSSGRVTAPARLLHDPAEAERLTVGDILVCPTIDSSWIPLFFSASGIVVEVGGILSHGAIIARELGIPTVINVQGAMSAITDGQRVTVDGGTGEIALLP